MYLKALIEKRNNAMTKGQDIIKNATIEKRSLNEDETNKLKELRSVVTDLNKQIEETKNFRDLSNELDHSQEIKKDFKGDKMNKDERVEKETRSVELYLRGQQDSKEYRDLESSLTAGNATVNTVGNGGVTIGETVSNQIIKKMENEAPVFAMAELYPSTQGRLTIARETASDVEGGFIGEGINAKNLTSAFDTVTLAQKRVAAAFQLTNDLINDSAVDIVGYAVDRVSRAVARTVSRNMLIGAIGDEKPANTFKPIIGDAGIRINNFAGATPTVEELIGMYTALHQSYQNGAAWIMSKAMFDAVAKLKDGDGRYLIFAGIVSGTPEYRLFNCPVYVDDVLDKTTNGQQIIFGNFHEGYAVMVKKGMNLVHVTQDTTQALAGGHLVVLDAYLDGAVKNPDAFVIGAVKTTGAPKVASK